MGTRTIDSTWSRLAVWLLWGFVGLLAFSGPVAYVASVVLGSGVNLVWLAWTAIWGLPWSILPLASGVPGSTHALEAALATCAVSNVVVLGVLLRAALARTPDDWLRDPRSLGWRVGLLLGIGSFLLVGFGVLGVGYAGPFFHVRTAFDHPFVFGCAAALMMAGAVSFLVPWRWVAGSTAVLCVGVAAVWGLAGWYFVGSLPPEHTTLAAAPDESGYEVIKTRGSDGWFDSAWYLSIRQTRGLLSREFELGCLSNDDPSTALKSVTWAGSGTLVVSTPSRAVRVRVDSDTGRPISHSDIWNC